MQGSPHEDGALAEVRTIPHAALHGSLGDRTLLPALTLSLHDGTDLFMIIFPMFIILLYSILHHF